MLKIAPAERTHGNVQARRPRAAIGGIAIESRLDHLFFFVAIRTSRALRSCFLSTPDSAMSFNRRASWAWLPPSGCSLSMVAVASSVAAGVPPAVEPRLPARRKKLKHAKESSGCRVPQVNPNANSGRQDAALYGRRDAHRYRASRLRPVVEFVRSQLLEVEVRQLVQALLFFRRQFGRHRSILRDSSSRAQSDTTLIVPRSPSTRMTWPVRMICVAKGTLTTAGKPYSRATTLP